jgi:hypothetical protein
MKAAPLHPNARSRTGLKRPDKGFSFFDEEPGRVLFLFIDIFQGHHDEDRHENYHRPDDKPG